MDFYKHLPPPAEELIEGVTLNEAWKSYPQSTLQIKGHTYSKSKDFFYDDDDSEIDHALSYEAYEELHRALTQLLPSKVYMPIYGESFLGIHYLIDSYLQSRFPIAVPRRGTRGGAHGVAMSPLSFTVHDFLHLKSDGRKTAWKRHSNMLLEDAVKGDHDYEKAIPVIVEHVNSHYRLITNAYRELLKQIDRLVLEDSLHIRDYKQVLGGFFWLVHEDTDLLYDAFSASSFIEVLRAKKENTLEDALREDDTLEAGNLENPRILFKTSPHDGSTLLSDEEIIDEVLNFPKTYMPFVPSGSDLRSQLKRGEVTRSSMFIDVTLTLKTGQKIHCSGPTAYHKHKNAVDNLKLLKFVGMEVALDPLSDELEATMKIAEQNITLVQKSIKSMINTFVEKATEVVSKPFGEREPLEVLYSKELQQLRDEYQRNLALT